MIPQEAFSAIRSAAATILRLGLFFELVHAACGWATAIGVQALIKFNRWPLLTDRRFRGEDGSVKYRKVESIMRGSRRKVLSCTLLSVWLTFQGVAPAGALDLNSVSMIAAYGGPEYDTGKAVARDGAGNILVAGHYRGTFVLGAQTIASNQGSNDLFFAKYSAAGQFLGIKTVGGAGNESVESIAVSASGRTIYVAGTFAGTADFGRGPVASQGQADGFIARYDWAADTFQCNWVRAFGAYDNDAAYDIAIDSKGNVVATGGYLGAIDFGPGVGLRASAGGGLDLFIMKLSPDGTPLWFKTSLTLGAEFGQRLVIDAADHIVVAGKMGGALNFGLGPTPTGTLFVAQFTPDGAPVWQHGFAQDNSDRITGLAIDAGHNVFVSGWMYRPITIGPFSLTPFADSHSDIFFMGFSNVGRPFWGISVPGKGSEDTPSLGVMKDGTVVATGRFNDEINLVPGLPAMKTAGGWNGFLATFRPQQSPTCLSAVSLKSTGDFAPFDLLVDPTNNNVVVTGTYTGTAQLAVPSTSNGSGDIFVLKAAP